MKEQQDLIHKDFNQENGNKSRKGIQINEPTHQHQALKIKEVSGKGKGKIGEKSNDNLDQRNKKNSKKRRYGVKKMSQIMSNKDNQKNGC